MRRYVSAAGADSRTLAPHSLRERDLARCSQRRLLGRAKRMRRYVSAAGADSRPVASPLRRAPAPCSQRHMPSAVDVDGLAGDVGRVGQQKMHGLGDVLGRALAFEWRVRNDALA